MKHTLNGCIVGLSGFIGPHHLASARSIISPRVDIDACVPGREENFQANVKLALKMGFQENRIYPTLDLMLKEEKGRSDFVLIATPNNQHMAGCIAAAQAGYHVVCDKPLGRDLSEAISIVDAVRRAQVESCVTPSYCGHAALLEARHRTQNIWHNRDLRGGTFRYFQGWLSKKTVDMMPNEGLKQAAWRRDPEISGLGGATGDILSHLLFQLYFITGLRINSVQAKRRCVVGERTDDEAITLVTLENGAVITLQAVQYAGGHQNDNFFELWFTGGRSFGWDIRESEFLWVAEGGPRQIMTRDNFTAPTIGLTNSMPSVHIDGWHDANARLLTSFAWKVLNKQGGEDYYPTDYFHPDFRVGRNMNAVTDAVIESSVHSQGSGTEVKVNWRL